VEPSGSGRELLSATLLQWGFHVVVVSDAASGLAYLDALPRPALVIAGGRGRGEPEAVAQAIRARPDSADFEVVLWAVSEALFPPVPPGVRAVLARPLDQDELEEVVLGWKAG
jgi:hypothetical protein